MKAIFFHIRRDSILASLSVLSLCVGFKSPTNTDQPKKGTPALPESKCRNNILSMYICDLSRITNKSSDPSKPIDCRIWVCDPDV